MVNKTTPKIEAQVVDAIRCLQAVQGSTQREIVNYIAQEYDLPASEVRRQVQIALKRGITYGILQRTKGGCFTYNQRLFKAHPFDAGVEIACKGRRGKRKSRRRSRKRRKSKRRQSRSGGRRRKDGKAEEPANEEIDESELKMVGKQSKRSNSLLRKDAPDSEASSTGGKSDEIHE